MRTQFHPHSGWSSTVVLALVILAVTLGGCGGGGSPAEPPPDPIPPLTIQAVPAGGTFAPGDSQSVELIASGEGSADVMIYYQTDLTMAVTDGMLFTGAPIPVAEDTVLRFAAVADDPVKTQALVVEGDEYVETYQFVDPMSSYQAEWAMSGHGDIGAEAWRHWDGEAGVASRGDPACSKCHTGAGIVDWADDGALAVAAAPAMYLGCGDCHALVNGSPMPPPLNAAVMDWPGLNPVEFPAFDMVDEEKVHVSVSLFGPSNLCMSCHQGRASTDDVDEKINDDPVGPYSFTNVHYYAAAASYMGGEVRGGYQYPNHEYVGRNTFPSHTDEFSTCTGCHMPDDEGHSSHTFEADISTCTECHTANGEGFENLSGSPSVHHTAITTLTDELWARIQNYATNVLGIPIIYSSGYPYYFQDTDGDGQGDGSYPFNDHLLRATYNYQFSIKEPCGYIHNGTYLQQILYDSIVDLGGMPTVLVPGRPGFIAANASRTQQFHLSGHGDSASEVFRHWDEEDGVVASRGDPVCAKCHNTGGFNDFAESADSTVSEFHLALSTVGCTACHNSPNLYDDARTKWEADDDGDASFPSVAAVTFPSGDVMDLGGNSNLCMSCHSGRSSTVQVDAASPIDPDPGLGYNAYGFINIHYYAAAASFFGTEVRGGYEYEGVMYDERRAWSGHSSNGLNNCVACHMSGADHTWEVPLSACTTCHTAPTTDAEFKDLGLGLKDGYDAIKALEAELYGLLQEYAETILKRDDGGLVPAHIGYDFDHLAYPYFFYDLNDDGVIDETENGYSNGYKSFDFLALTAAYNLQFSLREPCGYVHNGDYLMQILEESISQLENALVP